MNKPCNCPACGSNRIQKAKIISRARIPISNDVLKKLSPPVEPTSDAKSAGRLSIYIGALLLTLGINAVVTGNLTRTIGLFLQTMGVILVFIGISLWALSEIEVNAKRPKYKENYDRWERLWYCSHCRNTFYDA